MILTGAIGSHKKISFGLAILEMEIMPDGFPGQWVHFAIFPEIAIKGCPVIPKFVDGTHFFFVG